MPDHTELEKYLSLFACDLPGYLVVAVFEPIAPNRARPIHHWVATSDIDAAVDLITSASVAGRNVYLRANVQSADLEATASTVSAMTVVTIDFDLKGDGHAAADLPSDPEELHRLLTALQIPQPTVTLHTGGGLLGVWQLEEPILISSPDALAHAKRLSQAFQQRVISGGRARGYKVDNTSDLVRACRVPGTRNWKTAYGPEGRPVSVSNWHGDPLPLSVLESIAANLKELKPKERAVTPRVNAVEHDRVPSEPTADWRAVEAGCAAVREWASVEDGLPEPEWYALASVVGRCVDGDTIFHRLSADDRRYSSEGTSKKLRQAVQNAGPRLCSSIAEMSERCSGCAFRGLLSSPIQLGYALPQINALASQWVYVASQERFLDLRELEVTQ